MLDELERFFRETAPVARGDRVLVAFSAGPDSTALLWGLAGLREVLGVYIEAAHLDHGLDSASADRAAAAARLCRSLSVKLTSARASVAPLARRPELPLVLGAQHGLFAQVPHSHSSSGPGYAPAAMQSTHARIRYDLGGTNNFTDAVSVTFQ